MTEDSDRAPSAWQDPNGPRDADEPQDPYASPPPYQYDYGSGPPSGLPSQPPPSNGATVAALVVCIVEVVLLGGIVAIPGIVCAAVAMGKVHTDPAAAKKLTIWAWVSAAVAPIVAVILFVLVLYPAMQSP